MLTEKQVEAYKRDGYLRVEGLFTQEEVKELNSEMNLIIEDWWGEESIGWRGPWRDHYLPEAERKKTKAVIIANPHFYSARLEQSYPSRRSRRLPSGVDWSECAVASYRTAREVTGIGNGLSRCTKTTLSTRTMAPTLWIASSTSTMRP